MCTCICIDFLAPYFTNMYRFSFYAYFFFKFVYKCIMNCYSRLSYIHNSEEENLLKNYHINYPQKTLSAKKPNTILNFHLITITVVSSKIKNRYNSGEKFSFLFIDF